MDILLIDIALTLVCELLVNGNPLVFYHGTPNGGFSEFYEDSYFTTNLDLAQDYQDPDASGLMHKDTAEKPEVYSVYLSLQNPFDTRDEKAKRIFTEEYEEYLQAGITSKGLPETGEAQYLLEFLKEEYPEYDSIIVDMGTGGNSITGWEDKGEAYIVFNPNQIKSTDNKGDFNPESNNIYE